MIDLRLGAEHSDFDVVHPWLTSSYWSPGVSREKVERAAAHSSMVINAFLDGRQVGYCRVISDRASFAYLCDVFVAEEARGKGVGQAMVGFALEDPEHQNLRRWLLATHDAHSLYEKFGFKLLPNPERWMAKL